MIIIANRIKFNKLECELLRSPARQEVQGIGEHRAKWDDKTGIDGTGEKEVPLFVIDADGANIKRQQRGNPKKTREDGKTFEIKTAVILEGWEETTRGKYKLKNPIYYVHRV